MSGAKPEINKPCELGRAMGANLARFADAAEQDWIAAGMSFIPQRCRSCAFRAGTYPNGCVSTTADATKCMMEGVPFYCHHGLENGDPRSVCAGWMLTQDGTPPVKAPWEFSGDYTDARAKVEGR